MYNSSWSESKSVQNNNSRLSALLRKVERRRGLLAAVLVFKALVGLYFIHWLREEPSWNDGKTRKPTFMRHSMAYVP